MSNCCAILVQHDELCLKIILAKFNYMLEVFLQQKGAQKSILYKIVQTDSKLTTMHRIYRKNFRPI